MKDWRKICNKLLFPPVWLIIILAIVSTAALVAVLGNGMDETPVAYIIYVLAFYTLTVVCIACRVTFPEYYKIIRKKVYGNSFGNRYMTDVAFKTHMNLYRSFIINFLYAVFNVISGIYYDTAWFMLFAAYYIILAVMRFLLLLYTNRNGIGKNRLSELRISRLCAVILLTVNLSLSGAVMMMLHFGRGFEYYGVLIYVMAAYTFYITIAAIVNMVKYKRYNSPVMSMAKSINLAAALMSMLSLETAMLSQFGADSSPGSHRIMIIATGAGISLILLCMSVYIIRKTSREIKGIKRV